MPRSHAQGSAWARDFPGYAVQLLWNKHLSSPTPRPGLPVSLSPRSWQLANRLRSLKKNQEARPGWPQKNPSLSSRLYPDLLKDHQF